MRRLIILSLLTFSAAAVTAGQMHDHGAAPAAANGQFNPTVVADGRGGFYTVYIQLTGGAANVMLRHSLDGVALSQAVRVNHKPGDAAVRNENPPKIAIGRGNEVYVVWANEKERWKGNIRFARSTNGGAIFSDAIDLNSDAGGAPVGHAFQSIVVDPKGRIHVAWIDERRKTAADRGGEIWMATSEDGGKTFSPDKKILSDVCECCRTTLAVDSAGRLFLSYRLVPSAGAMYRDIAIARSDDGGRTFRSSPVSHDGWEINACPVAGATMTIDSTDRIHVAWLTEKRGVPRLLFASSTNHGQSFGEARSFAPGEKLAKHANFAALPGGRLLVAWDDLDGASLVKWGILDPVRATVQLLGSQRGASFPIVAVSGGRMEVVALQAGMPEIFRHVGLIAQ